MARIDQSQRKTIGDKIKELRKAKNWKQGEFAERIGSNYHQQEISYWENGTRTPPLDIIATIAQVLGTTTDYLLGLTDASTTDKDLRFVCDYTGLSIKAVEELHKGTTTNNDAYVSLFARTVCEFIDFLLTYSANNDDFGTELECLIESASTLYLASDNVTEMIDKGLEPSDHCINTVEDQLYYRSQMYTISKLFDKLAEDFSISRLGVPSREEYWQRIHEAKKLAHSHLEALFPRAYGVKRSSDNDQT